MNIVSTKMTNTVATNVSITCHSKKITYKIACYILNAVLLAIILLLIITIGCNHYANHKAKQKSINALAKEKWKIINFKKFILKLACVIISMT